MHTRSTPPVAIASFLLFTLGSVASALPAASVEPAAAPAAAANTAAQPIHAWPPTPRNLRVLPADTAPAAVIETMKGWALALGVRCTHCHVGNEGEPLTKFDFASDEKTPKRVARAMVELVASTNAKLASLPAVRGETTPALTVSCGTCHRGVSRPQPIEDWLSGRLATDGVAATIADYRKLRGELAARGAYDFSWRPLLALAQTHTASAPDTSRALLELASEVDPAAAPLLALVEIELAADNRTAAIAALRRAITLEPNDRSLVRRLRGLEEAAAPTP